MKQHIKKYLQKIHCYFLSKLYGKNSVIVSIIKNNRPDLLDLINYTDADNIFYNRNVFRNSRTGKQVKIEDSYKISDSVIGDYTYISKNSHISRTIIGKFCSIGPNLVCGWGIHPTNGLSTSPMFYSTRKQNGISLAQMDKMEERKQIEIGNDVFIGMNVSILDGVKIGDGAVIGAGCVVTKDVPPYALVVGCPMTIKKYRFDEETVNELLKIKWWDWKENDLKNIESMFFDVKEFIGKYK